MVDQVHQPSLEVEILAPNIIVDPDEKILYIWKWHLSYNVE